MMKVVKAIVPILVGITFCCALLAGLKWVAEPMHRPPQGLHGGSEAELVRDRYPRRLVDPAELDVPDDEVVGAWVCAEIKARLNAVCVSLGILAGIAVVAAYSMGKWSSQLTVMWNRWVRGPQR